MPRSFRNKTNITIGYSYATWDAKNNILIGFDDADDIDVFFLHNYSSNQLLYNVKVHMCSDNIIEIEGDRVKTKISEYAGQYKLESADELVVGTTELITYSKFFKWISRKFTNTEPADFLVAAHGKVFAFYADLNPITITLINKPFTTYHIQAKI